MISVIIPLYNKETSIQRTIDSVLKQTFVDFELLIIDDGSTDSSVKIVNKIEDPRIQLFTKINGGVSDARNFGIDKSKGESIFFLDADDIIYPNCLEILKKASREYIDGEIITANYYFVEQNGEKHIASNLQNITGYISCPLKCFYKDWISFRIGVMLFKRDVFFNEKFDKRISVHEDTDMWIRLLSKHRLVYVPDIVHEYLKEFSILSENPIILRREFSYYIDLKKSKSKYESLVLANNLLCSMIGRIFRKDYKAVKVLLRKNLVYTPLLIYVYIVRKTRLLNIK